MVHHGHRGGAGGGACACFVIGIVFTCYYGVYVSREKGLGDVPTVATNATITDLYYESTWLWYHKTKVGLQYQGTYTLLTSYCCDTLCCGSSMGDGAEDFFNWAQTLYFTGQQIPVWYNIEDSPDSETKVYCIDEPNVPTDWIVKLSIGAIFLFFSLLLCCCFGVFMAMLFKKKGSYDKHGKQLPPIPPRSGPQTTAPPAAPPTTASTTSHTTPPLTPPLHAKPPPTGVQVHLIGTHSATPSPPSPPQIQPGSPSPPPPPPPVEESYGVPEGDGYDSYGYDDPYSSYEAPVVPTTTTPEITGITSVAEPTVSVPSVVASTTSVSSTTTSYATTPTTTTPVSSASGGHVQFLLLAEFDILTGSGVKLQYPYTTGIDESVLAEFMLPDGVHKRSDDWTVFFLNRPDADKANLRDSIQVSTKTVKKSSKTLDAQFFRFDKAKQNEGWRLTGEKYRVNLSIPIIVKDDTGKQVDEIKKRPHMEYSKMDNVFIGIPDYEKETAIGLRFSNPEDATTFLTHLQSIIDAPDDPPPPPPLPPGQLLYCLNRVTNKKDSTVTRGSIVKALAICSKHHYIELFRPFILLALDRYFTTRDMTVLTELYHSLNAIDLSAMPILPDHKRRVLRSAADETKKKFPASVTLTVAVDPTTGAKITKKQPIYIPLTTFPDEVGDPSITMLLKKFGRQVMIIYNAVLQEKRIIFLGFTGGNLEEASALEGCTTETICLFVLATVAMVCPPLKGVVNRCFPYTNLCYLDFMSIPGYITGVANPMFEQHAEWWDVLCNIQTGKVTVNPKLLGQFPSETYAEEDNDFFDDVEYFMNAHYSADKIRSLFHTYTQHLVDVTYGDEVYPTEDVRIRTEKMNELRAAPCRSSAAFQLYRKEKDSPMGKSLPASNEIQKNLRKLRVCKNISCHEIEAMYQCFLDNIKTEEQLEEFLSYLPESEGGLSPVAVGLFHQSEPVRCATVQLFQRLDAIKTGNSFVKELNLFYSMAYQATLNNILASQKRS
ncbi:methionyl-tRNA synthetase [Pelomyxa schiedti]|nr:methionyl-tRNA synthetase [Pelomyxa schiedti]